MDLLDDCNWSRAAGQLTHQETDQPLIGGVGRFAGGDAGGGVDLRQSAFVEMIGES